MKTLEVQILPSFQYFGYNLDTEKIITLNP